MDPSNQLLIFLFSQKLSSARFFLTLFQWHLSDAATVSRHQVTMVNVGQGRQLDITVTIPPETDATTPTQGSDNDDKVSDFSNPTILALVIVACLLALVTLLVIFYLCYQVRKLVNQVNN